jgi:hypothetical protein
LVERNLAKVEVESSRLFSRSTFSKSSLWLLFSTSDKREAMASLFYAVQDGALAKRLGRGLQILLDRFDSGARLQQIQSPGALHRGFFLRSYHRPMRGEHPNLDLLRTWLAHRFVELPGIRLGQRLASRFRARGAGPAARNAEAG